MQKINKIIFFYIIIRKNIIKVILKNLFIYYYEFLQFIKIIK